MKILSLREINNSDIALLTKWLNQNYILKWYHDTDDWLQEIKGRNDEFSWIHHFIVMDEETPVGFCQYYDCCDANDMEIWYEVKKRGEIFSIDYLIGNEGYLNKGYGKALVRLLTETVWQKEKANQIIVQPDEDNHASNHVLMANGYVYDECKNYYCKSLNERRTKDNK